MALHMLSLVRISNSFSYNSEPKVNQNTNNNIIIEKLHKFTHLPCSNEIPLSIQTLGVLRTPCLHLLNSLLGRSLCLFRTCDKKA